MKGIGGLFILLFLLAVVGGVIYFIGDNAKITSNTVAVTLVNGTYINYSSYNDSTLNITMQNINDTLFTRVDSNNVTLTDLIASSIAGIDDNTTQDNKINANNETLSNSIDALDGVVTGLNTRQSSDNTTVSNRFSSYHLISAFESENTTLTESITAVTNKQSSDNTTVSNRFLDWFLVSSWLSENTTLTESITAVTNKQSSDNTTVTESITAITTQQEADNTTVTGTVTAIVNKQASDNTTIKNTGAFLGLNNVFTGTNYFNVINVSGNGYLDGDVRTSNSWSDGGWLISGGNIYAQTLYLLKGINTTTIQQQNMNGSLIPILDNQFNLGNYSNRWLSLNAVTVNGTNIWAGTVNILNRINSNNETITNLITGLTTQQEADNTTVTGTVTAVTTKVDANNQTLSDRISGLSMVTTLPANNISAGKFGGGVGLFEFSNLSIWGNFTVRSSSTGSEIFRIIDDPEYGYYAGLISAPDFNYGLTVSTINAPSGVYDNGVRITTTLTNQINKQASDNTTIFNNLTGTNTRINVLTTRQSADNTTMKEYVDSVVGGTSDNTTQNNLINANNVTLKNYIDSVAGGTSDNTTQANLITGNNNTINAVLGTKLNLTGGVINGYLNVTNGNLSISNNHLCLNANCSRRIYTNATHIIIENLG